MLPAPTLSFTLPSLHGDGINLDCRVYHPQSLDAAPKSPPWRKHAAVVAHPYAPLGGSFDDGIVDMVASSLLKLGFLVSTFNFRGASGSAGRTSWTARAERADYMSVVGFLSHYVHFLDPFRQAEPSEPTVAVPADDTSPDSSAPPPLHNLPILLLGGYSYGAMITAQLPPLETILGKFDTPSYGSPAAEIRLRAEHLAGMQNTVLASARAAAIDRQAPRSPRRPYGLRVGGDEENRKSHDSRRSFSVDLEDRVHKGVSELMAKAKRGQRRRPLSGEQQLRRSTSDPAPGTPEESTKHEETAPNCLHSITNRITHRPAYILVSPLQGVVTNLATMSIPSPLASISRRLPTRSFSWSGKPSSEVEGGEHTPPAETPTSEAEGKLVSNSTLAIYGDCDGFVAARKLRDWAFRLQAMPNTKFRAHEVSGAGHFWTQGNSATVLREAVKVFSEGLLAEDLG